MIASKLLRSVSLCQTNSASWPSSWRQRSIEIVKRFFCARQFAGNLGPISLPPLPFLAPMAAMWAIALAAFVAIFAFDTPMKPGEQRMIVKVLPERVRNLARKNCLLWQENPAHPS